MTKILDTVESYEAQLLELVEKAQAPVVEYVAKGVDLVGDRLPDITYPEALPTPLEVLESQVAFAKKLIDAQSAMISSVLETVAPVAGYAKPARKTAKTTKTAKAAKAA